MTHSKSGAILLAAVFAVTGRVQATFHFMQIEQVIGGVGGDATVQAIQLRMRSLGQNLVGQARLYVHDASGGGRTLLLNFPSHVANNAAGRRVLITTAAFTGQTTPATTSDFIMIPIPPGYLPAGSLTFEDDFGTIYWRLSWGGASYTGPTIGAIDNDLNGDFGPPFAGLLPSTGVQALRFQGASTARSISNSTDYALTSGAAVFSNNAGQNFTVTLPPVPGDLDGDRDVDLDDHALYAVCLAGPDVTVAPQQCALDEFAAGDRDSDDDIDLRDTAAFFRRFLPPAP